MNLYQRLPRRGRMIFRIVLCAMLGGAFIQGYQTTHDLHWAYDTDFDRDMAFVRNSLDGQFGKDPNYSGEFLWYNPLLFSIESGLVKMTGLPINVVLARAGVYLNIAAPIAFVIMLMILFGPEIALAGLCSFLFLASGDIPGYGAATYSPWLYPVCFVQAIFYFNVVFLYKALMTDRYRWFLLLGFFAGVSFLGHMGPTIIIILMTVILMGMKAWPLVREKAWPSLRQWLGRCVAMVVPFLVVASPLLFFVIGKYQLHTINQSPSNYSEGPFDIRYPLGMLKANFSLTLLIALVGLWWFLRYFREPKLPRLILLAWTGTALGMFLYTSLLTIVNDKYGITLPGTVPAFHYYFYLKSVQSVYFGFGLVFLAKRPLLWGYKQFQKSFPALARRDGYLGFFALVIFVVSLVYFPFYQERKDFVMLREGSLMKEANKDKMGVYYFIVQEIPMNDVILSEPDMSIFPVMASARKMVAIETTFSNPFVSYTQRNTDRQQMYSYLLTGFPTTAAALFAKYQVKYVLLSREQVSEITRTRPLPGKIKYENNGYVILAL